jgi:DNA polymerase III subunit beta
MELKISREILLEGVQKTLGIVEKRTTMPILNNVLLKTGNDKIRIIATNREISLIADYDAEIVKPGEITLSARKLFEMIREIQGGILHISMTDSNWILITCGKTTFKMPGISADDYPKIDEDGDIGFFKIKGDILLDMISKTFFAMSTDETRVNLNGTLFEAEKGAGHVLLKMVATDGHRLSLASVDTGMDEFLTLEKGVIIPRKGIAEIRKLVESDDKELEIGTKKGFCILRKDNMVLKVSLIDSDYPDYRRVIALDEGVAIELDREPFLRSLRRMGVISSERYSGVKIKIQGSKLLLNSNNPDVGEASDEIDIPKSDKDFEVGYNVRYLIDAVEAMNDKSVLLELRDGLRPGTIKPAQGDRYLCVIMPLKM